MAEDRKRITEIEVARYLKTCPRVVCTLAESGRLPAVRRRPTPLFDAEAIAGWVARKRSMTRDAERRGMLAS